MTAPQVGSVVVHAHLRERGSRAPDAPDPEHRWVQVEAPSYDAGRDLVLAQLPDGWIVCSWRVE